MINYISSKEMVIYMSKKARKIFAWVMLLAMVGSVIATIVAYAIG